MQALKGIRKIKENAKMLSKLARTSRLFADQIRTAEDPMKQLGPGISSFHRLIVWMFVLFIVLFLMHVPIIINFRSYGYYEDESGSWITTNTLGNMGFSKTECSVSSMIQGNTQQFKCNSGEIAELIDWGVTTNYED
jgi:hypothetical protein